MSAINCSSPSVCCRSVFLYDFFDFIYVIRCWEQRFISSVWQMFLFMIITIPNRLHRLVQPLRYLIKCLTADGWTSSFIEPKLKEKKKNMDIWIIAWGLPSNHFISISLHATLTFPAAAPTQRLKENKMLLCVTWTGPGNFTDSVITNSEITNKTKLDLFLFLGSEALQLLFLKGTSPSFCK